jgi:hypothetical protein
MFLPDVKEREDELTALGLEALARYVAVSPAIPVGGVGGVAFLAVEIGMDPCAVPAGDVLGDLVSGVPVATAVVPESEERGRETGGRIGQSE